MRDEPCMNICIYNIINILYYINISMLHVVHMYILQEATTKAFNKKERKKEKNRAFKLFKFKVGRDIQKFLNGNV